MQELEQAIRQTSGDARLDHALGAEGGLVGMFQQHGVTRQQRGDDAVHGSKVGVVPRGHGEQHAHGVAAQKALEAGLVTHGNVGQRVFRQANHAAGALFKPAQLARAIAHRAAHLPRQLFGVAGGVFLEGVDQQRAQLRPLGIGRGAPLHLRRHGPRYCVFDFLG